MSAYIPAFAADPAGRDEIARVVGEVCTQARREGLVASITAGLAEISTLLGLALKRTSPPATAPPPSQRRGPAMWLSARFAWKRLLGARANAAWAVGTLALGIGLSTSVFSVLDSVLWRPAPYPEADRLVQLATYNVERKFLFMGTYSPALIRAWRSQSDLFDRVEGYDTPTVPFDAEDGSETVTTAIVTPGLLPLLNAAPEKGRLFSLGEGRSGTDDGVLVSDEFWRARLKSDPDAIGRRLTIDDRPRHIIGILPASFRFPNGRIEVWMPFDPEAPPVGAVRTLNPVARLAAGRTFAAGALEARSRGTHLSESAGEPANQTAYLYPLSAGVEEKTAHTLWILAGAVVFLFMVVSANVANLSLSRALDRRRDMAVHAALGATTSDLVREALFENAFVAALGSVAGLAIAWLLTDLARVSLPDAITMDAFNAIALNGRAAAFAVALGSLSAVLFGVPMAFVASRASLTAVIGTASRTTSSRSARRLRSGLVVAEVTMSTALLVGAALMTRAFVALETASKGYDAANLISIRVGLPGSGYRDLSARAGFVNDVVATLRRTPGIVSATEGLLPTDARPIMLGAVAFADRPDPVAGPVIVPMHDVPVEYFGTLGIPLLRGRLFAPEDDANTVVVSEAFAKKYWPGQSALGAEFRGQGQDWQHIVGVVGDVAPLVPSSFRSGQDLYYQSGKAPQALQPRMSAASSILDYRTFLVRADRVSDALTTAPRVIHTIDPHVIIWRAATVDHLYADAIARPRTVFLLMAVFAGVGLLLAMAGMYGVLTQLVGQRLREIGVRLALGARPAEIGRQILGSGLGLTALGLVLGLVLAAALARAAAALLTDVGRPDAVSVAVVIAVLTMTALLAAWSPARRAMRVDPVQLLREQ